MTIKTSQKLIRQASLIFIVVWGVLLWSLFLLSAHAQNDARVRFYIVEPADAANTDLYIGDQITMRLEITHPPDSNVVLPQVEPQWDSFTVVEQTAPTTVNNNDGTVTTFRDITVALFEPGSYQTPSLEVTHRTADGTTEELAAPVIPVQITTVLTNTEDTELRDIRGQIAMETPSILPWVLAALLIAIIFAAILGAILLWLYNRWQKRQLPAFRPVPVVDTRPPEVIAYAELDRIRAMELPRQNQVKEHYSLVGSCLRRYIEGRYNISALERTTDELRTAFRRSSVPPEQAGDFLDIFDESDLVKFARYEPLAEDVSTLIDDARVIIDKTTPTPEPVASPPDLSKHPEATP